MAEDSENQPAAEAPASEKPKTTKASQAKASAPEAAAAGAATAAFSGTGEPRAESPSEPAPVAPKAEPKPRAAKKTAKKADAPAPEAPKENLSLNPDEVEKPKIIKAKGSKNVHSGFAHVLSTFNNTIVTITDLQGNVIGWSSAGKVGFKGSRKSTAYAAQMVAQDASRQAMGHGLKEVEVLVRGPGAGRESAVRALQAIGLDLTIIRDVTPVPHNGCRPPKQRRV